MGGPTSPERFEKAARVIMKMNRPSGREYFSVSPFRKQRWLKIKRESQAINALVFLFCSEGLSRADGYHCPIVVWALRAKLLTSVGRSSRISFTCYHFNGIDPFDFSLPISFNKPLCVCVCVELRLASTASSLPRRATSTKAPQR